MIPFAEKAFSYLGLFLVTIGTLLLWLLDLRFGFLFTVFVAIVMIWYIKTKKKGDIYLKRIAEITGCDFKSGGFGYGKVFGYYKGRKIEVSVNKTLDTNRSLAGFALSYSVLQSAIGSVAGIKNFTTIKVEHRASIREPYKIDDRTYVDKNFLLYLPESNGASGLPKSDVKSLVAEIDRLIKRSEEIEGLVYERN